MRRLLEKSPRRRTRFAADAGAALRQLGRASGAAEFAIRQPVLRSQNTWVLAEGDLDDQDLLATDFSDVEPAVSAARRSRRAGGLRRAT